MVPAKTDEKWMRLAIKLAKKGRPHPNPPVGAVVVLGESAIGQGWHDGPGSPHAEQMAIDNANCQTSGATLYVTLEPCCHTIGRDGRLRLPCWQRCVDAGISRIVIACEDVDPRTAGKGIQQLRDAGIRVDIGTLETEAVQQQRGFRCLQAAGRPFVIHKVATTLDGHTACDGGDSRWITGPEARRAVHQMRAESDAIIVGAGTVISDDPDLTVRSVRPPSGRQPRVVVFDRTLRIPLAAKVVRPGTVIVTSANADPILMRRFTEKGCHIIAADPMLSSTRNILTHLADIGMGIVMIEAGGTLAA